MRKIKKINGYLVVKFNDRELRDWAGTALGNYGVIDAELYTGNMDIDRSVMEYDGAETLEEAIEQARGLESELDVREPAATYTIIKETDETIEEVEVDPVQMVDEWDEALADQIESERYPEVNPTTAAHQLYGFMVALRELGIYDPGKCYVEPDHYESVETQHQPHPHPRCRCTIIPVEIGSSEDWEKIKQFIGEQTKRVFSDSGAEFDEPAETVPIKVNDTAVTLEYLKRQRDMATHNLFCYSANYAMTKPKEGYEEEWRKAGRDCEIVEELLRVISPGEEGGD